MARGAKRRVERMRRDGEFLIVELQVRAEDFLNCGFFGGERWVVFDLGDWKRDSAQTAKRWFERRIEKLLARSWHDPPSGRLVERLDTFRDALFTCLDYSGVPPDNNEAERSLRKLAIQRKVSAGSRSWKHAAVRATIMSVIETLRKENDDVLVRLQTLIHGGIQRRLLME